jgi:hypothetical protein
MTADTFQGKLIHYLNLSVFFFPTITLQSHQSKHDMLRHYFPLCAGWYYCFTLLWWGFNNNHVPRFAVFVATHYRDMRH